ncbi:unnamed protein product [Phytomonas sp. EM1]|nr:unnamed protein product [Phytomonas sp. EM1]|eukprot:CCW62003.1 unnamed protein product [Phytomonas sp. isolate EM1]
MDKCGNSILSQLNSLRLSDGSTAGDRLRAGTTPPTVAMAKTSFGGVGLTVRRGATCIGIRPIDSSPDVRSDDAAHVMESSASQPLFLEKASLTRFCVEKNVTTYQSIEHPKDRKYDGGDYFRCDSDTNDNNGGTKGNEANDFRSSKSTIMVPRPRSGVKTTSSSPPIESIIPKSFDTFGKDDVVDPQGLSPNTTSDFPSGGKNEDSPRGVAALINALKTKELHLYTSRRASGVNNSEDVALHSEKGLSRQNPDDKEQKKLHAPYPLPAPASGLTQISFYAPGFSSEDRTNALKANQFVADALGGDHIDNDRALKPIIRTLPELPEGGRYIVVGDVHGCLEQLEALVKKVNYTLGKDCLIIIGDYVNKGPLSVEVIRACQKWRALGVLGNHDYTLINCCKQMRRKPFNERDLRDPVKRLAMKFPLDCEYYLRSLPHILRMPKYNVLLVHAGFNVQYPLEEQNVYDIMHIRRLQCATGEDGEEPLDGDKPQYKAIIKGKGGVPWAKLWQGPELVIFGHDAYTGFQYYPLVYGIDTGCVYGNPLTCVVLSDDHPKGEFFSVPGLPKIANVLAGMPPPGSAIYEELEDQLDRQLIRPSRRTATSAAMLCSPSFSSSAWGQSFPAAAAALPGLPPTGLHASQSATPSSLKVPIVSFDQTAFYQEMNKAHKSVLMALSAAKELRALVILMSVSAYEEMLNKMFSCDMDDPEAQESFWVPFSKNVLGASLLLKPDIDTIKDANSRIEIIDIVQYVLGVCDEMVAVKEKVLPQLEALLVHANSISKEDRTNQWKGIAKYIQALLP